VTSTIRLALLAAFAISVSASPTGATRHCEKPRKAETATRIGERCGGLDGAARRTCIERCRGLGGCAAIRTLAYVWNVCRSDARGSVLLGLDLGARAHPVLVVRQDTQHELP
jgi:hypothetical protein